MTEPSEFTVAAAVASFMQSLSADKRRTYQQEMTKFVRWYGADRPVARMSIGDVDDYVEQVQRSQADPVQRLTPFKEFLVFAKRQGLVETSLAPHVRIRRPANKRTSGTTTTIVRNNVHLTAEGYERLRGELKDLVAQRPAIADELQRAMADKDFRENAPLDAARDRQGQVEARIRELESVLRAAQIIDEDQPSTGRVRLGSTVVLHDLTHDEELRYSLVGPNEANPRRGLISTASPIGRALLEKQVGDEFEVAAPVGTVRYRLSLIVES